MLSFPYLSLLHKLLIEPTSMQELKEKEYEDRDFNIKVKIKSLLKHRLKTIQNLIR